LVSAIVLIRIRSTRAPSLAVFLANLRRYRNAATCT
jgi:hypothetical protein